MSRLLNRRLIAAFGVMAVMAGLLAFSLATPSITIGQETDGPTVQDPGAQPPASDPAANSAQPPASLPDTGMGPGASTHTAQVIAMLGVLGVMLAGAGYMAVRQPGRIEDR